MNNMQRVGVSDRLDVSIRRKLYRGANGSDVLALEDLAFSIEERTFTTLIGPSGCGKTTLLRIIAGLDPLYEGKVGGAIAKHRIGFVFQEPRLLPWRSIGENIALASFDEMSREEIVHFATLAGIEKLVDSFPNELSLGQARRVSLARALAARPKLLLLDEPFVSLDEAMADRLRQILLGIWREQELTILMVSHDVREAIYLSDRLIMLSSQPAHVVAEHLIELSRDERSGANIEKLRQEVLDSRGE